MLHTGKTYTMVGEPTHPANLGVVPRAFNDLFAKLAQLSAAEGWEWSVKVREVLTPPLLQVD